MNDSSKEKDHSYGRLRIKVCGLIYAIELFDVKVPVFNNSDSIIATKFRICIGSLLRHKLLTEEQKSLSFHSLYYLVHFIKEQQEQEQEAERKVAEEAARQAKLLAERVEANKKEVRDTLERAAAFCIKYKLILPEEPIVPLTPYDKLIASIRTDTDFSKKKVAKIQKKLSRIRANKEAGWKDSARLGHAFYWASTREGPSYWAWLHYELRKAKKLNNKR